MLCIIEIYHSLAAGELLVKLWTRFLLAGDRRGRIKDSRGYRAGSFRFYLEGRFYSTTSSKNLTQLAIVWTCLSSPDN